PGVPGGTQPACPPLGDDVDRSSRSPPRPDRGSPLGPRLPVELHGHHRRRHQGDPAHDRGRAPPRTPEGSVNEATTSPVDLLPDEAQRAYVTRGVPDAPALGPTDCLDVQGARARAATSSSLSEDRWSQFVDG